MELHHRPRAKGKLANLFWRGSLLAQIACPTLVIVGSEDKLTPPSDAEKMSQTIPNAQLEVIATAGHLSNLEQSEPFNRLVANFLQHSSAP